MCDASGRLPPFPEDEQLFPSWKACAMSLDDLNDPVDVLPRESDLYPARISTNIFSMVCFKWFKKAVFIIFYGG